MSQHTDDGRTPGPCVLYEKRGRVAYVTINRPEKLNALNLETHESLGRAWDEFERDDDVRVGVLTGMGNRAFSTGQDLKELAARTQNGTPPTSIGSRSAPGWPRLTERFHMSKPLIARVNGIALGGGFELALACDVIIAASHSVFGFPEARLGLIPGAGGVFRLARQIPFRTAVGFLITGRQFGAPRALELGLVNAVVAPDELDDAVNGWIEDILECAPLSVKAIKEVATASSTKSLQEAFASEYYWEKQRAASSDCREGPAAFVQKRKANWSGK